MLHSRNRRPATTAEPQRTVTSTRAGSRDSLRANSNLDHAHPAGGAAVPAERADMIAFPIHRSRRSLSVALVAACVALPSAARAQTSTLPPTDISNQHAAPGAGATPPQAPPPGYTPEPEPVTPL